MESSPAFYGSLVSEHYITFHYWTETGLWMVWEGISSHQSIIIICDPDETIYNFELDVPLLRYCWGAIIITISLV